MHSDTKPQFLATDTWLDITGTRVGRSLPTVANRSNKKHDHRRQDKLDNDEADGKYHMIMMMMTKKNHHHHYTSDAVWTVSNICRQNQSMAVAQQK